MRYSFFLKTQLHRMAATGMSFSEQQLNAMYQQQMMTQQVYQQWMMALPPSQRVVLQHRMQAYMQEVQIQMTHLIKRSRNDEVSLFSLYEFNI